MTNDIAFNLIALLAVAGSLVLIIKTSHISGGRKPPSSGLPPAVFSPSIVHDTEEWENRTETRAAYVG